MPSFSHISRERLDTCDSRIVAVMERVIKMYDIRVLEGRRGWGRQDEMFFAGKSQLRAGQSKHNSPIRGDPEWRSLAIDVAPYPIDWHDSNRFVYMAGLIIATGASMGVPFRWGGNWDMDQVIIDDQNFDDLPHFEIVEDLPRTLKV